jgi:hypothetical protein
MELKQPMGDAFGLLAIGAGGENDLKIGHTRSPVFTKYGSFLGKDEAKPAFTEKIEQANGR